jgi:hypothetical protein
MSTVEGTLADLARISAALGVDTTIAELKVRGTAVKGAMHQANTLRLAVAEAESRIERRKKRTMATVAEELKAKGERTNEDFRRVKRDELLAEDAEYQIWAVEAEQKRAALAELDGQVRADEAELTALGKIADLQARLLGMATVIASARQSPKSENGDLAAAALSPSEEDRRHG